MPKTNIVIVFKLKDKSYMGKRNIVHKCYAFVRPNISEMFERVSGPKDGTEVLDQNPSLAGLNKVLADTSKNVDSEIRDLTEKIAVSFDLIRLFNWQELVEIVWHFRQRCI